MVKQKANESMKHSFVDFIGFLFAAPDSGHSQRNRPYSGRQLMRIGTIAVSLSFLRALIRFCRQLLRNLRFQDLVQNRIHQFSHSIIFRIF
jgi:hypothetical protein